jgi:hypothetical protein
MVRAWTVLVVLASSPVAAQDREAPRVFVDGVAFVDFERTGRLTYQAPVAIEQDANGTVAGGGFAVGTFLGPHVSVRLETAFPASWDSTPNSLSSSVTFSSGGVTTAQFNANPVQQENRRYSAAALVGYHTGRQRRARLGFLAGVAFLQEREHSVIQQTLPGFPPFIPTRIERTELTATRYRAAPTVGVDADFAVASRIAIVPHVRVDAGSGALSVRPGIGVRWMP